MKANEAPEKIYLEFYRVGDKKYREWVITPKTNDEPIQYIRKDALVKYLYEEKGYPITLNGELVHWDELNKHLVEYIKLKKDAFIEKAWDWIEDNLLSSNQQDKSRLHFEQFKKYMKGE